MSKIFNQRFLNQTNILNALSAKVYSESLERPIVAAYAGDFLSRVMGKAPADCVWLTIMGNANVAGVAVLADIPMIILCEGVTPDPILQSRAKEEGITLASTRLPVFEACVIIGELAG